MCTILRKVRDGRLFLFVGGKNMGDWVHVNGEFTFEWSGSKPDMQEIGERIAMSLGKEYPDYFEEESVFDVKVATFLSQEHHFPINEPNGESSFVYECDVRTLPKDECSRTAFTTTRIVVRFAGTLEGATFAVFPLLKYWFKTSLEKWAPKTDHHPHFFAN